MEQQGCENKRQVLKSKLDAFFSFTSIYLSTDEQVQCLDIMYFQLQI